MPYLIAVKSIYLQLREGLVTVLNDGTLTEADRALLKEHISGIHVMELNQVPGANCPKGNCWERLLLISHLCQESFVIQMDADTVTLAAIPEVIDCVRNSRSFTLLGDQSHPGIETAEAASQRYQGNKSPSIAAVAERSFHKLPDSAEFRYVRGNAGYVGFACKSFTPETVERFSQKMESVCGPQWHNWGSEQVASNLMVANAPCAVPLPFPKYASYWVHPNIRYEDCAFIHFIGTHRYDNGLYVHSAHKVSSALQEHSKLVTPPART